MKHTSKFIAVILLAILFISCKKPGNALPGVKGVFVVGNIEAGNPNNTMPILWKDGVPTDLSNGAGGNATAVALYGSNVYVGGNLQLGTNYFPVIWKNGVALFQSLPDSSYPGFVTGLNVVNGVAYACGEYYDSNKGTYVPVYWKNGVMNTLEGSNAGVLSIFVSGNDVYTSGYIADTVVFFATKPVIWKNGKVIFKGTDEGQVNSVFVLGPNVYGAGLIAQNTTVPVLWKNGVATVLNADGGNATHVFVNNNDVYVSGSLHYAITNTDMAMVWKNGTITTLAGLGIPGMVNASTMVNNNFYAIGYKTNVITHNLMLWKNGVDTVLDNNQGSLLAIAVQN